MSTITGQLQSLQTQPLHQRLGQHSQAITAGSRALSEDYLTSVVQLTLGRRLFYSYLLGVGDEEAAKAMLTRLEMWGEETSELQQLEWLLQRYANTMGTDLEAEIVEEVTKESDVILSNYPNPFNPSTIIRYQLPENGPVTLQVFDLLGRQVAELVNEVQSAGMHSIHFNAEHLSSGLYIYRLQTGEQVLTQQMSLIKSGNDEHIIQLSMQIAMNLQEQKEYINKMQYNLPTTFKTIDDKMAEIAHRIDGFAGYYVELKNPEALEINISDIESALDSSGGDSGAPVFILLGEDIETAEIGLYGIHWGSTSNRSYASAIQFILSDLGIGYMDIVF